MWARISLLRARISAVTVVPMPSSSALSAKVRAISSLALVIAAPSREEASAAVSESWSISTSSVMTVAEAMSPPACPPIPSATASRWGPA